MPKTTSNSSFFSFLPYRRGTPETPSEDTNPSTLASATQRYVPRPFRHEPQSPAIYVHPLARGWSIASTGELAPNAGAAQNLDTLPGDFPISPPTTKPMDIPLPIQTSDSSSPVLAQPVSDAAMEQVQVPEIPSQIIDQPVSDAPDIPSPDMAQAVSDAAMEQVQVPEIPSRIIAQPVQPVSDAAFQILPKKRRNSNSQTATARRRAHADARKEVTREEKTRLVEQLDLTTRRVIENKDQKILELQAQIENYRMMMEKNSTQMGPPLLTGEDVNMARQPNTNNQFPRQDQALLTFEGDEINMSEQVVEDKDVNMGEHAMVERGRPRDEDEDFGQGIFQLFDENEENSGGESQLEPARAPEHEEISRDVHAMDAGRPKDARRGKRPLDEDEEDFGLDEIEDSDKSDDDTNSEIEKDNSSRPSVPKPIYSFRRPRGGAGPRFHMDPQTSTAANSIPNIPNISTSTLQSAGITSEQVAAITHIVMAVQNQNTPKLDIPSRSKMNVSHTIKEQKSRPEKNPRRTVLLAAVRRHCNSLLRIEHDTGIKWRSQPSEEIVDDFAKGHGPDPGLVPMQLAFRYTKKAAWNKNLGEQFFDDFLEQEGSKLRLQEDEWPLIYELFWQRFDNLKKEWKKWQKKDGEDDKDVHHRNSTINRMDLRVKRRNARRRQLRDIRLNIADKNTTKADGTKDDVWHFLWLVASQLDLGGMSSDESNDNEPSSRKSCVIKSVPWRNEELIPYLQRIDGDFNRLNCYGNRRPGNPFRDRVRVPGMKRTERPAIAGLPINFYDKTWYANLSNGDIRFLQAKPELPFPVIVAYN